MASDYLAGLSEDKIKRLRARFFRKVQKAEGDQCWLWTGYRDRDGYGKLRLGGGERRVLAHRLSYELHKKPIPKGLCVCHSCDNPPCVNPAHLWTGTNDANREDSIAKGRNAKGDRHGARTRPERWARGDKHFSRTHPELLARGDRNGSRVHPERLKRGSAHPIAKLNETKVREIRDRYDRGGITQYALAKEYGVTQRIIHLVVVRELWKHVR